MSNYTTLQQLVIGFVLSLLAVVLLSLFPVILDFDHSLSMTVVILTLCYSIFLLKKSPSKTGQASLVLSYIVGSLALVFLNAPFDWISLASLLMIWLVRFLFGQSTLLKAGLHALILLAGLSAASTVLVTTHSWFLTFWCFFLIQPLFNLIDGLFAEKSSTKISHSKQSFNAAFKSANTALERLSQS